MHVGELPLIRKGRVDSLKITTPKKTLAKLVRHRAHYVFPAFEPDGVIEDTFSLRSYGVEGVVYPLPGHTPGSVAIAFGKIVFAGDVLRGSLLPLFRRTPQYHFFAEDSRQLQRDLAFLIAQEYERWFVGHGGPLRLEKIRRRLSKE